MGIIGKVTLTIIVIILVACITLCLIVKKAFDESQIVTKGQPIASYENPKTALLVIDVQKTLTDTKSKAALNIIQTDPMIDNINKIIEANKNMLVVYITNEFKKGTIANTIFSRRLEEGSETAKMDPRIKIVSSNRFIKDKGDSFTNPQLDDFLIKNKVNHLIITGVDAQYCVDRTIRGALNRKYNITIISDAIATKNDKKRKAKLEEFRALGVEETSTTELLNNIR